MTREDLEREKLHSEVESLRGQLDQARLEKRKLELEVELLLSQVGGFGKFARVAWPIVSVILSTVIAGVAVFFTYSSNKAAATQTYNSNKAATTQKDEELENQKASFVLAAIRDAADETRSNDSRVAAIWQLSPFYLNLNKTERQFLNATHALVTVLQTGADDDEMKTARAKQVVRLAAAEVLGRVTPCEPNQKDVLETKGFLFSSSGNREVPGFLTSAESSLLARRATLKIASAADLKLAAIRVVVQRFSHCLTEADLDGFDLKGIDFSKAQLDKADLGGSDLRGGIISGADFRHANLSRAHMLDAVNWKDSMIGGANIKNLQDAPVGFRDWALDQHAVEMEPSGWQAWKSKNYTEPPDWDKWRASGFAVRYGGVPVQ